MAEVAIPYRYLVAATFNMEVRLYWGANDLTTANRLILHALEAGASHARQKDTRPEDDLIPAVTEEERAALAEITPRVRSMY